MSQLLSVVELVNTLYAPHQQRDAVLAAQQTLQNIQRSSDACTLAHQLLQYDGTDGGNGNGINSGDVQNVQFFGALTYTVYITQHPNNIDNELADTMAQEVIDACRRKLASVVINKLISNLGKLYAKIGYAPLDVMFQQLASILENKNDFYILALTTCKILAEELNRVEDMTTERNRAAIESMLNTTTKAFLNESMSMLSNDAVKKTWLECIEEWVNYVSRSEFEFSVKTDMNDYFSITIALLAEMNDTDALDLITNVYDTHPAMINHDNKGKLDNLIFSEWSTNYINQSDSEDNTKLSRFITLFLDTNMVSLAAKMVDPAFDYKFEYLLHLTNQPGDPVSDESFSVNLLDFWILFTEDIINDTESIYAILKDDSVRIEQFKERTKSYFLRLCEIYWRKSHLIAEWEDFEDEFYNFRRDVGELYESLFTITKGEIFHTLVSGIPAQLAAGDGQLHDVEASLFLITCLANVINENNSTTSIIEDLDMLFTSGFLENVSQLSSPSNGTFARLHQYLVKNTIRLLSELAWFYQSPAGLRHVKSVLIFLFANLTKRQLQDASSRAILLIVDTCRSELSSLLNDFETAAASMLAPMKPAGDADTDHVDVSARARIIRSYASILQTVRDPQIVAAKVSAILDLLKERIEKASASVRAGSDIDADAAAHAHEYVQSLAASAVGLAKGLQLPEDWEDYYERDGGEEEMRVTWQFWTFSPEGIRVHGQCMELAMLLTFPKFEESLIEQVCAMFRAGLTEPLSGPFVVPVVDVVGYVIQCCQYHYQHGGKTNQNGGSLAKVIELYGTVVKCAATAGSVAKSTGLDVGVNVGTLRVGGVVGALVNQHGERNEDGDTDILQSIFTMLGDICGCYPGEVLECAAFERVLQLGIRLLAMCSQQRFVVQAVTKFWTQLIYLRKGKREDVQRVQQVFSAAGDTIVEALMRGFLSTPRSCMDFYSDVWRSLAAKYGQWLEMWTVNAASKVGIDSELARKFGKQLVLTRGQRTGVRIVKEFWLSATGMVDYGV